MADERVKFEGYQNFDELFALQRDEMTHFRKSWNEKYPPTLEREIPGLIEGEKTTYSVWIAVGSSGLFQVTYAIKGHDGLYPGNSTSLHTLSPELVQLIDDAKEIKRRELSPRIEQHLKYVGNGIFAGNDLQLEVNKALRDTLPNLNLGREYVLTLTPKAA